MMVNGDLYLHTFFVHVSSEDSCKTVFVCVCVFVRVCVHACVCLGGYIRTTVRDLGTYHTKNVFLTLTLFL